jgi:predicted ATP-grasp superfamily ATP-dependent carboligase
LIIVGASARAAAASAVRAGFSPITFDLFADRDGCRFARMSAVPRSAYPHGLFAALASHPELPWVYTGGLENDPGLIAAASGRLMGVFGLPLRRARDPFWLARNLPPGAFAAVKRSLSRGDVPRGWLIKPRRGSGGLGVAVADRRSCGRGQYFQTRHRGRSLSAVFVATQRQCRLVGVSRQLVGEPWLHAGPFQYCGSIGPLAIPAAWVQRCDAIGHALADRAGLRGTFGVDAIDAGGGPIAVEVNPRYVASVEVLELGGGTSILGKHLRAFGLPRRWQAGRPAEGIIGKAVYFAPRSFAFPATGPWDGELDREFDPWRVPRFADVPWPNTAFRPGEPVLTVLTRGPTVAACLQALRSAARELDVRFSRPRRKSPRREPDVSG